MSDITTGSGRRIFYDDLGSGPPLVLLPGMTAQRRGYVSWLAEALADRFRVVSMDNRDTGESDPEANDYDIRDLSDDVAGLLDALGIVSAHVLGHSMGGGIAVRFAIDHPGRVDRLVIVGFDPSRTPRYRRGDPMPPPDEYWNDDPVQRMRLALPILVGSRYRARMTEADVERIARIEHPNRATWHGTLRQMAAIADHVVTDQLSSIHAPTLLIFGDEDRPEHKHALAQAIPDARAMVLHGVGHLPWVEAPETVIPAIARFLLADAVGDAGDGLA